MQYITFTVPFFQIDTVTLSQWIIWTPFILSSNILSLFLKQEKKIAQEEEWFIKNEIFCNFLVTLLLENQLEIMQIKFGDPKTDSDFENSLKRYFSPKIGFIGTM